MDSSLGVRFFYVVSALDNFVYLLDGFWTYVAEQMAKGTKFEVHLSTAADVNVDDAWEDVSYPNYTLNEPSNKLPIAIFEAPPCFGKRPATFSLEIHDESTVSIVIAGVYVYRDRFEAMGIPGGRVGVTDTSKGDFVRLMKRIDLALAGEEARIIEVLESVLKNLALRVFIDGNCEVAETPVYKLIAKLRERSHMHFVTLPPAA